VRVLFIQPFSGFSLQAATLEHVCTSRPGIEAFSIRDYTRSGVEIDRSFLRDIQLLKPDVLLFSTFFWNLEQNLCLAEQAKAFLPNTVTVFGGPQMGEPADATSLLNHQNNIDLILCGEAEETLPVVLDQIQEHVVARVSTHHGVITDLTETIPGFVARGVDDSPMYLSDNGIERTPSHIRRTPIHATTDFSVLFGMYSRRDGHAAQMIPNAGMAAMETVRGCRNACTYCLYCTRPLRELPMELVREAVEFYAERNQSEVRVCDSHFGGTRRRALEIFHLMACTRRENPENPVRYHLYPDPLHVDDEYVCALLEAGCSVISIGVQTLDPDVAKRVGRHTDLDRLRCVLETFRTHNIHIQVDLMYGLPGQTPESYRRDVETLRSEGVERILHSPLMSFPGTVLEFENSCKKIPSPQGYSYDESIGREGYTQFIRIAEKDELRSLFPRTFALAATELNETTGKRLRYERRDFGPVRFLESVRWTDASYSNLIEESRNLSRVLADIAWECGGGTEEPYRLLEEMALFEVVLLAAVRRKRQSLGTARREASYTSHGNGFIRMWGRVSGSVFRVTDGIWLRRFALTRRLFDGWRELLQAAVSQSRPRALATLRSDPPMICAFLPHRADPIFLDPVEYRFLRELEQRPIVFEFDGRKVKGTDISRSKILNWYELGLIEPVSGR
jgi:radical SAM superfamily enzyme YgiQ (UPF0313 family)